MQIQMVLALVFTLVVAIFAVQNAYGVDVSFLAWQFNDISLVLVILGSVVAGALVTYILGLLRDLQHGRRIKELELRNKRLEQELAAARHEAGEAPDTK